MLFDNYRKKWEKIEARNSRTYMEAQTRALNIEFIDQPVFDHDGPGGFNASSAIPTHMSIPSPSQSLVNYSTRWPAPFVLSLCVGRDWLDKNWRCPFTKFTPLPNLPFYLGINPDQYNRFSLILPRSCSPVIAFLR
jgi:hypothetical protein